MDAYRKAAAELEAARQTLAVRFPVPVSELQLRQDLGRVRWRVGSEFDSEWIEGVVCPEDRLLLAEVVEPDPGNAPRRWTLPRGDGLRLLAPAEWAGRALLIRADGATVRIARLD